MEAIPNCSEPCRISSLLLSCQHTSPKARWDDFGQKHKASVFPPTIACTKFPSLTQRISVPGNNNEFTGQRLTSAAWLWNPSLLLDLNCKGSQSPVPLGGPHWPLCGHTDQPGDLHHSTASGFEALLPTHGYITDSRPEPPEMSCWCTSAGIRSFKVPPNVNQENRKTSPSTIHKRRIVRTTEWSRLEGTIKIITP